MSQPTVLVVEDDDDCRDCACLVLEYAGYEVWAASDGSEALGMLEARAPTAIVTDLAMPQLDGLGLYAHLRTNPRIADVPIAFLTALPDRVPAGCPVLSKPFAPDELLRLVGDLCSAPACNGAELRETLLGLVDKEALVLFPLVQWLAEHRLSGARAGLQHCQAGQRLRQLVAEYGWPTRSLVGHDGATAAWRIAHQDLADPDLMRFALPLLARAALHGEAARAHVAMLVDRICFFEGRAQLYGTQYGWDAAGQVRPWPIEDAGLLDFRRRQMGLCPIALNTAHLQRRLSRDRRPRPLPLNVCQHRRALSQWAARVGWRDRADFACREEGAQIS